MDYEKMLKKLGSFGKYQKRLYAITLLPVVFDSFGTPVSNFLLADQLHRCKIPTLENDTYAIQDDYHHECINKTIPSRPDGSYDPCNILNNGTTEACTEWVYDKNVFTNTVNSQFNLVCGNKQWHSYAILAYFIGYVIGSLFICPLGDIIGRRNMVCICSTLQFIVNITMPFSVNVYMFAVLRVLDGICGITYYHGAFIIGMELVGPSKRLLTGTLILLIYVFGEILLVFIAYFIRDWKWLQLTLAIPMCLPLLYWIPSVLPESPRWLISRGRNREAAQILQKAAKINKVNLGDLSILWIDEENEGFMSIMKKLIKSKKLVIRWIIIFANWFVISFIYYGMTVNIGKLGGDLHLNFVVSCVVEGLGYSLVFVMDRTGRKPLHLSVMFGSGAACLISILPVMFGDESLSWIMIAFSMVGKFGVSAGFGEIFVYTGELFPTVVRSFVMGICSSAARLGSLISPYLYLLTDGKFGKALPLLIYGVLSIAVGFISLALPETKQRTLLEHVEDAEHEEDLLRNGSVQFPDKEPDEDSERYPL